MPRKAGERTRAKEREAAERIKWMMILRVIVVTVLLGFTVLLQLREGTEFFSTPLRSLYLFSGLFYFLTLVYSIAFHLGVRGVRFTALQLAVDLVLVSGIVVVTGGVESLFSIAYFLVIIGASSLLYRSGGFAVAGGSALLYGAAVLAPFSADVAVLIDAEVVYGSVSSAYVIYRIIFNTFAFFLVAGLSSHLAESLRRTGEELSVKSSHLAKLERRSENILQNIASGLVTTDLDGMITYINRAAERISDLDRDEVMGKRLRDFFGLDGGWDPFKSFDYLEGPPFRIEGWLCDREQEQFLGMTFSALRDENGGIGGVICSFQDLTQIRKMEGQIRRSDRLAVVGELAAGMAHEIRNPLASMSGSIQLLAEDLVLGETGRELMEIINREVARLDAIITDFLRFANPRPPQYRTVDLREMLEETARLLQRPAFGNCAVETIVRNGGDMKAEVDPDLIRQVFWNFATNAIEAMKEGGKLTMSIGREETAGGEASANLVISFADSGEGIAADEVEKVFTPFHSTKENGTGLGLSIVFRIVEAHRGRIEVKSDVGRGTVFTVYLPQRQGVASLAPLRTGEVA